jgi:hypothetical protein
VLYPYYYDYQQLSTSEYNASIASDFAVSNPMCFRVSAMERSSRCFGSSLKARSWGGGAYSSSGGGVAGSVGSSRLLLLVGSYISSSHCEGLDRFSESGEIGEAIMAICRDGVMNLAGRTQYRLAHIDCCKSSGEVAHP